MTRKGRPFLRVPRPHEHAECLPSLVSSASALQHGLYLPDGYTPPLSPPTGSNLPLSCPWLVTHNP